MDYRRMAIEIEAPEGLGYNTIECNLSESSFTDQRLGDLGINLDNLTLFYGDHLGRHDLRCLVADHAGVQAGHVLITPGAAPALFIIATSLLEKGDEMIVTKPNYATNIETPRALGAQVKYLELKFEEGYAINIDALEKLITPQTKLISVTYPHNPTGVCIDTDTLNSMIRLVEGKNTMLLVDETYREMTFEHALPVAASLSKNVISVTSMSKSFGLPGIRIGWIVCQHEKLMETFLAAKEQIFITNAVIDEHVAYEYLLNKDKFFPKVQATIRENFIVLQDFMNTQEMLEWIVPQGGCVCFPRLKSSLSVDMSKFHELLLGKYRTYVGRGHWFDEDPRHIRIGYSWDTTDHLRLGLSNIIKAFNELL